MKMDYTGKEEGDERRDEDRMGSRFILKLAGLVEVWYGSKHGEIKDDLKHFH